MLLAHAIRRNTVSLAQAQKTYKENVVEVNTLVTSVLTSSIPTFKQPPPDMQDFTTAYEKATGDALTWVNTVMARLLNVPDEVRSYDSIISGLLKDAKNQASTLVDQPSNPMALKILNLDLKNLSEQLSMITTFISGAIINIENFQGKLPDMATQLQTIAKKATIDAQADQKQIDKLNADIANLQDHINSLTAAIVALGIVDALALTIGIVATIAMWPAGLLAWFAMGPVIAVATTFIVLDALEIKKDQAEIHNDQQNITGLTADVATFQILANSYTEMANKTQMLETNLRVILHEWQTLENDVNAAIADINTATGDITKTNFKAVLNDINDAITEWNLAYTQAGNLHLELNVNNAQLQLGMTSSDVQAAMAKGTVMNIIDYYNHIAAEKLAVGV